MLDFVDRIIVVNDCSNDATESIIMDFIDNESKQSLFLQKVSDKIIKTKYNKADQVSVSMNNNEAKHFTPAEQYPEDDRKARIF